MIEQVAYGLRRHALLLDQVEDNARIQVAAPGAHHKTIERGEAHGRCHALAPMHRAHAGAAAEMGDNDATIGRDRPEDIGKHTGDILVG